MVERQLPKLIAWVQFPSPALANTIKGKCVSIFSETISQAIQDYRLLLRRYLSTQERRKKQQEYNQKHSIVPKSTKRKIDDSIRQQEEIKLSFDAIGSMPKSQKKQLINDLKKRMQTASKALEFEEAARLRDEIAKISQL